MNEHECLVTISQSRFEELIVDEKDANRLKEIIAQRTDEFLPLGYPELKILRDLLMPEAREEEE